MTWRGNELTEIKHVAHLPLAKEQSVIYGLQMHLAITTIPRSLRTVEAKAAIVRSDGLILHLICRRVVDHDAIVISWEVPAN